MKRKLTLLCMGIVLTTLSALAVAPVAKDTAVWVGTTSTKWNLTEGNWMLQSFPLPLPMPATDSIAHVFQDLGPFGEIPAKTLQIDGKLRPAMIWFKNDTTNFTINRTGTTLTADSLIGTGYIIKQGRGNVTLDVANGFTGGTEIREGTVSMKTVTSPNVFGSKIILKGGTANFATSTSSSYPSVNVPVEIPAGNTGKVMLSRYSYWSSVLKGSGNLEIYCGGERTYLGPSKSNPVNWSGYTGNVTIKKNVFTGVTPGFYGLLLNSNRTLNVDKYLDLNQDTVAKYAKGIDSTFFNRKLTMGTGTVLFSESGTRAYAIGEIATEDSTALLTGYYKDSTTPQVYWILGGNGRDQEYLGLIKSYPGTTKDYNAVGLIKQGAGTLTLSNPRNKINLGVRIANGRVAIKSLFIPYYSVNGAVITNTNPSFRVYKNGTLAGNGQISGIIDLYGKLEPGIDGIGSIIMEDSTYTTATPSVLKRYPSPLNMRAGSVAEFEIADATSYDKFVTSADEVRFYNDTVNSVVTTPQIIVKLTNSNTVKKGDTFELLTAKRLSTASTGTPNVVLPTKAGISFSYAWVTDTVAAHPSYKLIVTANDPSGIQEHKSSVKVYPNPAHNFVQIALPNDVMKSVTLISINGAVVKSANNLGEQGTLDIKGIAPGVYTLTIEGEKATIHHKVVVK